MKATLAARTGLPIEAVGLKATTNEGVDDIGAARDRAMRCADFRQLT